MRDDDVRSLFQTIGGAALGVGLGLAILGLGFLVSRVTLADNVIDASTTTATVAPSRSPSASPRPTTSVAPTVAPTPSPTPRPTTTPDPMVVTSFQGQGLRLAALNVPANYTVTAPFAGRVKVELYQYVNGDIRQGANDQPSYPYIYVTAADREVKLRPGLLNTDIQLLVKDGDTVPAGAPLFKTITTGASSWHTFYDNAIVAQVVVSETASGTGVDPVPLFKK